MDKQQIWTARVAEPTARVAEPTARVAEPTATVALPTARVAEPTTRTPHDSSEYKYNLNHIHIVLFLFVGQICRVVGICVSC